MKHLSEYIKESLLDVDDFDLDDAVLKAKVEAFCKKHNVKNYEILPDGKVDIFEDLTMEIKTDDDVKNMINLNVIRGTFTLYLGKKIDFDLLPEYVLSLSLQGVPISNHTFIIMQRDRCYVQLNVENGDYSGLKIHYVDTPYIYPTVWGDSVDFFNGVIFEKAEKIMIYPGKQTNPIKMEKNIIDAINKRIKYIDAEMLVYNQPTKRRYSTQKVYTKQGGGFKEVKK